MKPNPPALVALEAQYDRLRKSLAKIGYISQGSVLQRSVSASGRSGYQWTRKVAQKTISLALSPDQFCALPRPLTTNANFGRRSSKWNESHARSSSPPLQILPVASAFPKEF